MSTSPDWVRMESELSRVLPGAGAAPARTQLLASLGDYAAAVVRAARSLGAIGPGDEELAAALEWLLRPVFICGHHRSGTTLLQSLLDGHPQLLSLPSEGTYFGSFAYVARRAPTERDIDRFAAEWVMRFVDPNFEPHFRLGRSDENGNPAVGFVRRLVGWRDALQSCAPAPFAPLLALAAAFRATAAPASAPLRWVEKTPLNERHAARLAAFGAARFIQLVRDPRAVLASLRESYRGSNGMRFHAAEHAAAVGRSLRLAARNPQRFGDRYLVVRYEDLADAPVEVMERVRQFLGLAPDAGLLVPTAAGREVRANSSFGVGVPGSIVKSRPVPPLAADQAALIGAYAARPARVFGYAVPVTGPLASCAIRLEHWPAHVLRAARSRCAALLAPLRRSRRHAHFASRR